MILIHGQALAQLPVVSKAVETRLYKGAAEEIAQFIGERQAESQQIAAVIEESLKQNQDEKEKAQLAGALEFFQGLSSQFVRLESELGRTFEPAIRPTAIGAPPYGLEELEGRIALLRSIEQQLAEQQTKNTLVQEKLTNLETDLKGLLADYGVLQKSTELKPVAFEKLGQIYSLQVEYALQERRGSMRQQSIDYYSKADLQVAGQVKNIFENLQLDQKDVERTAEAKKAAIHREEAEVIALNQESRGIEKNITTDEVRFDNLTTRISSAMLEPSAKKLLATEKERLAAVIETYQLKLRVIGQEKLNLKIQVLVAEFSCDWVASYAGAPGAKRISVLLGDLARRLDDLEGLKNSQQRNLSQAQVERSALIQKMAVISRESDPAGGQLSTALDVLNRQLMKADELIGVLSLKISENNNAVRELAEEIRHISGLLRARAGFYERVQLWCERYLASVWGQLKDVVYYPLFTFGGASVTLVAIFKLLFLLFVGFAALRLARRKITVLLSGKTGLSFGAINSITTLGYYSALVLMVLVVLSTSGVDLSQLSIILGALGVGIGFGLQTIANNFISGLVLLSERSIKAGDFVELETGLTGEVQNVAIRATIIRTFDGNEIIVPNSELVSSRVNTWTFSDDWRRIVVPFGVSYGSDPDEVARLATEAARAVENTVEDAAHPVLVRFEGFGDSSLDFSLLAWCRMNTLKIRAGLLSDYYFVLFRKFKEAGIEIPFPQRDLHLRSISPAAAKIMRYEKGVSE